MSQSVSCDNCGTLVDIPEDAGDDPVSCKLCFYPVNRKPKYAPEPQPAGGNSGLGGDATLIDEEPMIDLAPSRPAGPPELPGSARSRSAGRKRGSVHGLPQDPDIRVLQTMRGVPDEPCPRDRFPLSTSDLVNLQHTAALRRPIRHAGHLYGISFILSAIGLTLMILAVFVNVYQAPRPDAEVVLYALLYAAVTVLLYFAARGTYRCQVWAPVTMSILYGLQCLGIIAAGLVEMDRSSHDEATLISVLAILIIPGLCLSISIRAALCIPGFLASPLWSQEALIYSKL